ncbi:MAG: SAM-dependent methyltransferase [Paludibacter sp.]
MSTLYLIPTSLGESSFDHILPAFNTQIVTDLKYFIVEDIRTARRFLKKANPAIEIDDLTFYILNQHTTPDELSSFIRPLFDGFDLGVLSEAGCPAIADPGADIVSLAQQHNFKVVPLVGPSSILLSLMASGFNGQSFAFVGYLPIEATERSKMIRKLENRAYTEDQSQIFIETPYRNMKMLDEILKTCQPNTKLCIAVDITLSTEFIKTKKIKDWKNQLPDLNKRPCIFLIYK